MPGVRCTKAVAVIGALIGRAVFTRFGKKEGLMALFSGSRSDAGFRQGTKHVHAGSNVPDLHGGILAARFGRDLQEDRKDRKIRRSEEAVAMEPERR